MVSKALDQAMNALSPLVAFCSLFSMLRIRFAELLKPFTTYFSDLNENILFSYLGSIEE